jgi:hypothetical protein
LAHRYGGSWIFDKLASLNRLRTPSGRTRSGTLSSPVISAGANDAAA